MCDYSLMHLKTRLAENGETLIVFLFSGGTQGLITQAEHQRWLTDTVIGQGICVTCVPPGTRVTLSLADVPATPARWWVQPWALLRKPKVQTPVPGISGTFCQMSAETHVHRDAIRLDNGELISLQRLREGVRVTVEIVDGTETAPPVAPETLAVA